MRSQGCFLPCDGVREPWGKGTPRWQWGLGSGVGVLRWGQGQLSESLEKRRGMTSERPGSTALAVGAGAAGPGAAGRGLKLKEDEMGAIHTSSAGQGEDPACKPSTRFAPGLEARGLRAKPRAGRREAPVTGAGFRDQGQSPGPRRRRERDGHEPQGSPTLVLRGVRNGQQAQRSWIRADRGWVVGGA